MTTPQEAYKALAAIPSYLDASVLPSSTDSIINIQVLLLQRDLERNVFRKFTRTVVASVAGSSDPLVMSGPSVDAGDAVAQAMSPSGELTAVLRTVAGEKKKHFVEIWSEGAIFQILDATSIHDDFYADSTFGTLEWSRDETKLVYVAERKKSEEAAEKFTYKPDWGEAFEGKRNPSLVVLDLNNSEFKVLDQFEGDMSPGQAIFSTDSKSLIFTGYYRNPQFFGIVYCQNRLSGLHQVNIDGTGLKHLTPDLKSARSPRMNPDGTSLVFLSNRVNGPHASCAKLCKIDLSSGAVSTVVDFVRKPATTADFPGLYIDQLPKHLWVSSTKIITSSAWRSHRKLLLIDIESGSVKDITPSHYSGSVVGLFACSKWILATHSTPTKPSSLLLGRVEHDKDNGDIQIQFSALEKSSIEKAKPFYENHQWSIVNSIPGQLDSLEVILIEPYKKGGQAQSETAVGGTKPPLVIFPHGGPHSGFTTEFLNLSLVLVSLGFAVACVNFTGSLGFGQDALEKLIGRVGELDVDECQAVREYLGSRGDVDKDRTALTGGSHGGFIICHLLKDPTFKAASMRNPVTDIPALTGGTDIVDWGYAVTGLDYDMAAPPTATLSDPETFKRLRAASPMEHVTKVVTPTLMLLGSGDRRVPPQQGITWWQARQNVIKQEKRQGKESINKINIYHGTGHALDTVEAESNSMYILGSFFVEHCKV
ncbi:hypothetical protein BGW38_004231 [Lunasporangiospora selenospora]|uniref:Acylamino-acid-releasing enzyme n=1 Tax=Lunasporangiospora selenospora TaxID=979761 RepID=A0A9P6KGT6_9FUNG|nr:hypothetical protein BGW38_004231 [Lunasporangiospora selenospora]